MSRPYRTNQTSSSMAYEPYQTSEYDRSIQQAAERERAAEAVRSQSSTPMMSQMSGLVKPIQPPRLPGLNELFADKLLINPNSREGRKSPIYQDQRRDSVAQASYFDPARMHGVSTRTNTAVTPPLVLAPAQNGSHTKTGPLTIQSLCTAPEYTFTSPAPSLSTSPTTSQSSNSSLMQPMHHSQPTSPYELPPAFFGTQALAPATYVYQAASTYEGVSYVPGQGPCHMYKGGYSIPTHIFQDPVNLTSSKILRKRLSVACSTCRKKKIKCEPGPDGCLQCKKAQKPCRIEPAKRRQKGAAFQAEKSPA